MSFLYLVINYLWLIFDLDESYLSCYGKKRSQEEWGGFGHRGTQGLALRYAVED